MSGCCKRLTLVFCLIASWTGAVFWALELLKKTVLLALRFRVDTPSF
jgi:hypothetical protein